MKYIFILIISFVSLLSNAQTKFNIQAGIISTNNHTKQGLIGAPSYQNYSSFDLGINLKQKLYSKFISETGLFYNQKGYSNFPLIAVPEYYSSEIDHVNYLTLDQNFSKQFYFTKHLLFTIGAGGFIAKRISGSYAKDIYSFGNIQHTEGKINFGNTTKDQFQSLDAGLNFLLRLGYRKFDITAMFSPSVTNHIPKASQQSVKEKLQSVSFNLGYNF